MKTRQATPEEVKEFTNKLKSDIQMTMPNSIKLQREDELVIIKDRSIETGQFIELELQEYNMYSGNAETYRGRDFVIYGA